MEITSKEILTWETEEQIKQKTVRAQAWMPARDVVEAQAWIRARDAVEDLNNQAWIRARDAVGNQANIFMQKTSLSHKK